MTGVSLLRVVTPDLRVDMMTATMTVGLLEATTTAAAHHPMMIIGAGRHCGTSATSATTVALLPVPPPQVTMITAPPVGMTRGGMKTGATTSAMIRVANCAMTTVATAVQVARLSATTITAVEVEFPER